MVDLRPFTALRPPAELAAAVAAPPYDVIDTAEARAHAAGNPHSFLHISRPEIDLPEGADPHSTAAYRSGHEALARFVAAGTLQPDDGAPGYYGYRQHRGAHVQTGLVACAGVADYRAGSIRIHEYTRPDKEDDRLHHIDALDAHDEPVFLMTAPHDPAWAPLAAVLAEVCTGEPEAAVEADCVRHELWRIPQRFTLEVARAGAAIKRLYIADGHHRSAAAARLADQRGDLTGEVGGMLAVTFPGEELLILPYQRVVADLAGQTTQQLLDALDKDFEITPAPAAVEPARRGEFGLCLATPSSRNDLIQGGAEQSGTEWYRLVARDGVVDDTDPIAALDVSLLQDRVLAPLLGIADPRTDTRIGFVGGSRGLAELERLVASGAWAAAFSLHPTGVDELVAVADASQVMPPKSTWFEPKLRSGLFVHPLGAV